MNQKILKTAIFLRFLPKLVSSLGDGKVALHPNFTLIYHELSQTGVFNIPRGFKGWGVHCTSF